jgi:hypothetical protein
MVGLGPTIHEFLGAGSHGIGKLVDGRAKHDHDEGESPDAPAALSNVSRETRKSVTI